MNSKTPPYVILAEFNVPEEKRSQFLELAYFDSDRSLADEPGCHQFDILTVEDSATTVTFYEVYTDRAAFDAHTQTPHFLTFADGLKRLALPEAKITFFSRQHP
ncbi:MAG: putative quinol monooxygenase [Acidobacteriaceae bacterium]|nr:putative quinol monooxygenase [Acidobacteriaceae bacterium]